RRFGRCCPRVVMHRRVSEGTKCSRRAATARGSCRRPAHDELSATREGASQARGLGHDRARQRCRIKDRSRRVVPSAPRMLTLALALTLHATYEMADLKALEKQGSFKELVDHLEDITPSKRDKEWEGLAERGGAGWLGTFDMKDAKAA